MRSIIFAIEMHDVADINDLTQNTDCPSLLILFCTVQFMYSQSPVGNHHEKRGVSVECQQINPKLQKKCGQLITRMILHNCTKQSYITTQFNGLFFKKNRNNLKYIWQFLETCFDLFTLNLLGRIAP